MEPVRIEFTYTVDDLAEGAKAMLRESGQSLTSAPRRKRGRVPAILYGWIFFVGLAIAFFVTLQGRSRPPRVAATAANPPWDWLVPILPWILISGFIWFFVVRQHRRVASQMWEQNPSLQQPQTLTVGDEGVSLSGGSAETRWQWTGFVGWEETETVILLRQPGNSWVTIPKRAATPEQLAALREAFDRRVVQSAGGFPVLPTQ